MNALLNIGVVRIFTLGAQMTCNDVIRYFQKRKELFVGHRYCRLEDQKPWPVCLRKTKILLLGEEIIQKQKMQMCKLGGLLSKVV